MARLVPALSRIVARIPVLCRIAARIPALSRIAARIPAAPLLAAALLAAAPPRRARAAPCTVVALDARAVAARLASWRAPPAPPSRPGLWRVLLPRRIGVTLRDQDYDGMGWYSGVTGSQSERGLTGSTRGYRVQVQWDLAPLWSSAPTRPDPLARGERMERLASRLAIAHRRILLARVQARALSADDPRCPALRVRARSALLVLRAVLGAVVGPSPARGPTSRSRPPSGAPPARPPARPRSRGRGRRR